MTKKFELDIREVSKRSGLTSSTLRFYEEKGLINSIGRKGLTRIFQSNVIDKLSLISLGQYAGFSLKEIAAMFSTNGKPTIDRQQLIEKAEQLDQTIKILKVIEDSLRHVANCPESNQLECPKFQKLVIKATKLQHQGVRKKSGIVRFKE